VFTDDDPGQMIDVDECRELLGTQVLGRVAVSIGALPVVVPVLYALTDDHVVITVRANARLCDALANNVVAFEVDHVDLGTNEGWTVLVVGRSRPALGPSSPPPWSTGPKSRGAEQMIRISLDRLSGLRVTSATGEPSLGGVRIDSTTPNPEDDDHSDHTALDLPPGTHR
jgi:hypothetical protein